MSVRKPNVRQTKMLQEMDDTARDLLAFLEDLENHRSTHQLVCIKSEDKETQGIKNCLEERKKYYDEVNEKSNESISSASATSSCASPNLSRTRPTRKTVSDAAKKFQQNIDAIESQNNVNPRNHWQRKDAKEDRVGQKKTRSLVKKPVINASKPHKYTPVKTIPRSNTYPRETYDYQTTRQKVKGKQSLPLPPPLPEHTDSDNSVPETFEESGIMSANSNPSIEMIMTNRLHKKTISKDTNTDESLSSDSPNEDGSSSCGGRAPSIVSSILLNHVFDKPRPAINFDDIDVTILPRRHRSVKSGSSNSCGSRSSSSSSIKFSRGSRSISRNSRSSSLEKPKMTDL